MAGIIGSPVGHSLSPAMHNAAFAACGLDWRYVAFEVPAGGAERQALDAVRALGLAGLSVTMPHKADVAALVDERSTTVEALGAANTVVVMPDGRLRGESTNRTACSTRSGSTTASTRRAWPRWCSAPAGRPGPSSGRWPTPAAGRSWS